MPKDGYAPAIGGAGVGPGAGCGQGPSKVAQGLSGSAVVLLAGNVAEGTVALGEGLVTRAGRAVAAAGRAEHDLVAGLEQVLLAVVDALAVEPHVAAPARASAGQPRRRTSCARP